MFGFLDWQRRVKRVPTRLGTMARQTSNAYRLGLCKLAAIGAGILGKAANGHNCRPSRLTPHPIMQLAIETAESA